MREGVLAASGRAYMRKLGLFVLLCCSLSCLVGCSGQMADPVLDVNRNIKLIPASASGYRAEKDVALVRVCGKQDPRNQQMDLGWGGETSPRCWYGRPLSPSSAP